MRRLLCRTAPLPGESLPSLVRRLAKCNSYDPLSLINDLCLVKHDRQFVLPTHPAIFKRVARLSCITPGELYGASAHRFAELLTPPESVIQPMTLADSTWPLLNQALANRQIRPETAAQFCPDCLKTTLYHRWAWLPVVVSVCPVHHCLLVDACPNCRQPVSIRAIVDGQCQRCKADLAQAQPVKVDERELFTQQVIQGWLAVTPLPDDLPGLPDQPPRVLYRVVDGLRLSLMSHKPAWTRFERLAGLPELVKGQKLTPGQSLALYTAAFEALTNWPDGFYEFLERFSQPDSGSMYHKLRFLYSQWLQYRWQYPEFGFLQQAFDEYAARRYPASVLQSSRYDPALIGKLQCAPLEEVAGWVGVSEEVALDMVKAGLLTAEAEPGVNGSSRWLINKQSVERLLDQARQNTLGSVSPEFTVDLLTASRMMAPVGLNAAGVLGRVAGGRLQAAWPPSANLAGLRFTEAALRACAEAVRLEKGWVKREDIAARMGVKVTVVSKWIDAGLLAPAAAYGNVHYFSRNEIDDFVQGHIFSDEAARILGVGMDVVQKWARKERLRPVAGGDDCHRYLFRREDVERLRPENRLTGPQLAKKLGLSRAQLWQWIKQGKVEPVSGPGIDGSRHYLFVRGDLGS